MEKKVVTWILCKCDYVYRCLCYKNFFFFFQAEDRIRDRTVTGVQTCALPIFDDVQPGLSPGREVVDHVLAGVEQGGVNQGVIVDVQRSAPTVWRGDDAKPAPTFRSAEAFRSEERRVGKECRSGW